VDRSVRQQQKHGVSLGTATNTKKINRKH